MKKVIYQFMIRVRNNYYFYYIINSFFKVYGINYIIIIIMTTKDYIITL